MRKEVYFKDFEGLLHHYKYIEDQLEKTVGKFEGFRPIQLRVSIDSDAHKRLFRDSLFGCEIIAHHPEIRNTILVHKFSAGFYQAVNQACRAVEKILRRHSRAKLSLRRRAFGRAVDQFGHSPELASSEITI